MEENKKQTKDCHSGNGNDRNDVSERFTTRVNENEENIVILPFPFNVPGGVPYYLEEEARYLHRPFVSGCVKEVRREPGSLIPVLLSLSLYFYFYFISHVYNYTNI